VSIALGAALVLVAALLAIARLAGVLVLSWWWVLAPLWLPVVFTVLIVLQDYGWREAVRRLKEVTRRRS
jgi:fatty acid desaturase